MQIHTVKVRVEKFNDEKPLKQFLSITLFRISFNFCSFQTKVEASKYEISSFNCRYNFSSDLILLKQPQFINFSMYCGTYSNKLVKIFFYLLQGCITITTNLMKANSECFSSFCTFYAVFFMLVQAKTYLLRLGW